MATRLVGLEAIRGIAALLVVFFHLQDIAWRKIGLLPLGGMFGAGDRGVDLFFVLSGFIIMWTHAADIGKPDRVAPYLFKRAARIYPSVWIITTAALVVYGLQFGGAVKSGKLEAWNIVASFMLLPQRMPALVNVTWTLTYEIFFYALFALVLYRRRLGLTALLIWQGAVALAACGLIGSPHWLIGYYLRPICLEFGIGIGCAYLVSRSLALLQRPWVGPALLLVGGGAAFGGIAAEGLLHAHVLEPVRLLFYGIAPGLLIVGLSLVEQRRPLRIPGPLQVLGAISYPLYLLNFSIMTLVWTALSRLPGARVALICGACLILAVGGGYCFQTYCDTPIQRGLRKLLKRPAQPVHLTAGAALVSVSEEPRSPA